MRILDLGELAAFVVVAETHSFSVAARRLHLTQPAVSRRVARLERSLGVRLLVRSSRSVDLTDAGAAVFAEAANLLASHSRVLSAAAG